MAHMWLLWWSKNTCTTKSGGERSGVASATITTTTTTTRSGPKNGTSSSCCCTYLAKIARKVKKQMMVRSSRRQSSFQCRYDPLSYSLNFDRSGCESAVDDQDYYRFYAFSSRFVANPTSTSKPTQTLPPSAAAVAATSHLPNKI